MFGNLPKIIYQLVNKDNKKTDCYVFFIVIIKNNLERKVKSFSEDHSVPTYIKTKFLSIAHGFLEYVCNNAYVDIQKIFIYGISDLWRKMSIYLRFSTLIPYM